MSLAALQAAITGNDWTANPSDSTAVSDSLTSFGRGPGIGDITSLSDGISKQETKELVPADSTALADAQAFDFSKSGLADSSAPSDTTTPERGINTSASDSTAGVSDVITSFGRGPGINDTETPTDAIDHFDLGEGVGDSTSATDAIDHFDLGEGVGDSTSATDAQTPQSGFNASAADSAPASDLMENILPNPSAETNTTNIGSNGAGSTITRINTTSHDGSWAIQVDTPGSSGSEGSIFTHSTNVLAAGDVVSVSAWVKGDAGGEQLRLLVSERDTAGAFLRENQSSPTTTLTTSWQRLTFDGVVLGASTARVYLKIVTPGTPAAIRFFVDSVMVVKRAVSPAYFDGDTSGAVWTGTAHASSSIFGLTTQSGKSVSPSDSSAPTDAQALGISATVTDAETPTDAISKFDYGRGTADSIGHLNLVKNPRFANATDGAFWYSGANTSGGTGGWGGTGTYHKSEVVRGAGENGQDVARITALALGGTNGFHNYGIWTSNASTAVTGLERPQNGQEPHVLAFRMRASRSGITMGGRIIAEDGGNAQFGTNAARDWVVNVTSTGAWQTITVPLAAEVAANHSGFQIRLGIWYDGALAVNDFVDITDVRLVKGTSDPGYFDPSSSPLATWIGTANASGIAVSAPDAQALGFGPGLSDTEAPTDAQALGHGEGVSDAVVADGGDVNRGALLNPGFEGPLQGGQGSVIYGSASSVPDTAWSSEGSRSLHVTATGASHNGVQVLDEVVATPGKIYNFRSALNIVTNSPGGIGLEVRWRVGASNLSQSYIPASGGAGVTSANATLIAPATTTGVLLAVRFSSGAGEAYVDDLVITESPLSFDRSQALADSLSISDAQAFARGIAQSLSDSVTPSDTVTVGQILAQAVADSLTLSDALSTAQAFNLNPADVQTLSDALVTAQAFSRTLADSLAMSDNVYFDRTQAVADAVTLADQQSKGIGTEFADALVLLDDTATALDLAIQIADAAVGTDVVVAFLPTQGAPYVHSELPNQGFVVSEATYGGAIVLQVSEGQVLVYEPEAFVTEAHAEGDQE
jgi:hypothetical protein